MRAAALPPRRAETCPRRRARGCGELHTVGRKGDGDRRGAVVGGTGAYAGARGTFTAIERKGGNERNGATGDVTITLLP